MDSRPSPTPPASARPKNPMPSSTGSQASSSSQQQPAAMPSSSKPVRGSTPTTSRSSARLAEGDKPTRPASRDSLKQKLAKKPDEAPRPSKAEEQLKALKSDFDGLRSHLTCKICDRLLYEPYIISCGHTYCYSCLCTWFLNNKARKTCPDCRIVVAQPPAPAYVIREMTLIFVNRAEVLPAGETLEQHAKWQKEEADVVQQDKNNKDPKAGGLFKGCFRSTRPTSHPLRALRDQEDGVDRCPICTWELEDAECPQCGFTFDDNGELIWTESFGGFSDMDETSERDLSGEDPDADLDMDDRDLGYDAYDEEMEGWQDYLGDEGSFMMRRYLAAAGLRNRRPMTHSEAGSRRSYSQSIISEIFTDEMDTVEEEDEEGLEEDSSMNDFIEDDEPESATSRAASSTPSATPQPPARQAGFQRRARRIVESEASSSISSVPEEEDEDEEDDGPIRPGRRNRNAAQTRVLNRANGVRRPIVPPSSASETSLDQDLDEHTRALLQAEGWMLQHDGPDDDMDEDEDDDDDSDGGRTTVGWDATAISNDRVRMGGSLTPTADRPRPNAPIRPPSRAGQPRTIDTSRGLRRRSSILSSSTANYEDGEADDDDSDLDQGADITMRAMNHLRSRRSQAQIRQPLTFPGPNSRFMNRGLAHGDAADLDTDDNSDNAPVPGARRRTPRTRPPEYDPRISWMFANHQRDLQGSLLDQEPRSTTPLARPRTANRNRPSPAQMMSPFMPPAPSRLRTPLMNNSANGLSFSRGPTSPSNQGGNFPSIPITASAESTLGPTGRSTSVASTGSASSGIATPSSSASSQPSANAISQAQAAAAVDMIDRPPSRISARPPSANRQRNSPGFSPVYPGFTHPNVGLNIGGRIFHPGNPWSAFVHNGVRPRASRQLREQSSTATLRAVGSRVNIRDGVNPAPGMRSPPSRINLRSQPSRRHLNNQSSTRTLRASDQARPPPSPTTSAGPTAAPIARPPRLTPDERDRRGRELINSRMRELQANPVRTNPWRPSTSPEIAPAGNRPNVVQHVRSNSNESMVSIGSSGTASAATVAPSPPNLNRHRSRRDIGAATASAFPITQATFSPPATTYPTNYLRRGSLTGATQAYESPFIANTRGMSPMVAAGNSGLL